MTFYQIFEWKGIFVRHGNNDDNRVGIVVNRLNSVCLDHKQIVGMVRATIKLSSELASTLNAITKVALKLVSNTYCVKK